MLTVFGFTLSQKSFKRKSLREWFVWGVIQGLVGIFIYYRVCFHGFNAEINQVNNIRDPSLYQNTYITFSVCFAVLCNCDVLFWCSQGKKNFHKRHRFIRYISIWIYFAKSPKNKQCGSRLHYSAVSTIDRTGHQVLVLVVNLLEIMLLTQQLTFIESSMQDFYIVRPLDGGKMHTAQLEIGLHWKLAFISPLVLPDIFMRPFIPRNMLAMGKCWYQGLHIALASSAIVSTSI